MKQLYSILFSLLTLQICAQEDLPTGKIEVIKDFEVKLTETKKIRIVPQPNAIDTVARQYSYVLDAPAPDIQYLKPELKPLAIQPEQKPTYYPLFGRVGFGNPNSLLADFSYDRNAGDNMNWGIGLHHLSANNKKIPLQQFSTTSGSLHAGYQLNENVTLNASFDAAARGLNFYGVDEVPSNPESLKRNFNDYRFIASVTRLLNESTSFHYKGMLDYSFTKDDLGSRENSIALSGELGSALSEGDFPLGILLLADLSTYKRTESYKLNNIIAEPYFAFSLGDLKVRLAGKALLRKNENAMLPAFEISYALFGELLMLRTGWIGEVTKNNFTTMSGINPYIYTDLDTVSNEISRQIFLGIKGIAGTFAYEFTGRYSKFSNLALYLQDEDNPEQFAPLFDNGSYIGFEGALEYELLRNVKLRSQVFQRFYSLDNESKPWHIPSFGLDGQITYTGGSDIYHVSLLAHGENGLPYRTVGGTETRLDPLIDLNIHADYYFTPALGAFVQVNNIFGNNRERWVNYPSYGFNAKVGVMFRLAE